ncbi:MAG: metal ABC transporter ATP-binding protein [Hyphomicrobiaceae bacterium]|nr:metal ABC transporter ATP-binding protein [Hyphomicrobiaceae bacterium]
METRELIRLDNVSVRDGTRVRVEGISLSITRGQIVTLIGPNGSGKSTTAKVVTGVLQPTSGSVLRRPGLVIGYVPQKLAVDHTLPMSVLRLMQLTGRYPLPEVMAVLEAVGIADLARRDVQSLSGGQFQRALLARALVRNPDLLVLDEPVQGVDFSGETQIYELIGRIKHERDCGILLISHDLHVVMAETDTVVCLNKHVCCTGAPEQVMQSTEYLSLFGPQHGHGLALYNHHHDHEHLPDGRVAPDGHTHDHHGHHHA